jgi:hypothetical protein
MAMPEAAFYFNYQAMLLQDYIGTPRQAEIMHAEAIAELVQATADGQFGLGVFWRESAP